MPSLTPEASRCLWEVRAIFNRYGIVQAIARGHVREEEVSDDPIPDRKRAAMADLRPPEDARSRVVNFYLTAGNRYIGYAHRYYSPSTPTWGTPWDPKDWLEHGLFIYPSHEQEDRPCPDCRYWREEAHAFEDRSRP